MTYTAYRRRQRRQTISLDCHSDKKRRLKQFVWQYSQRIVPKCDRFQMSHCDVWKVSNIRARVKLTIPISFVIYHQSMQLIVAAYTSIKSVVFPRDAGNDVAH